MTPWGYARCDDTVGYARCDDTVGYALRGDTALSADWCTATV